jgi:hypothetical protein
LLKQLKKLLQRKLQQKKRQSNEIEGLLLYWSR